MGIAWFYKTQHGLLLGSTMGQSFPNRAIVAPTVWHCAFFQLESVARDKQVGRGAQSGFTGFSAIQRVGTAIMCTATLPESRAPWLTTQPQMPRLRSIPSRGESCID